ncbi:MAG TPA: FHA domain-containing protein [Polyangia bacterium]|nr:FHA domain-containing protein [Polyangia bacterium]
MDADTLAELAQSSTRDEFAAKLPHLFLVLEQALADEDVGFATQVVDPVSFKRTMARRAPNIEVLPVVKAPAHPYPDRVSVGRARNCDIVMRDPSVSKLHAHFRVGGPTVDLVDIDSQNGTRVNGRALAPHQPVQVANGDIVLFGSVACKLVDAAALYDLLR